MREIDLLTLGDMIAFQPTDSQISLKMLLQERVNPSVLAKVYEGNLTVLEPYLVPFTLPQVEMWCRAPGFFHWLFTPDSFQVSLLRAKEQAVETVTQVMSLQEGDDPKLAMVRLKAAEILLKTGVKREQRVSNTLRIAASLPKHVKIDALDSEIRKLKESIQ